MGPLVHPSSPFHIGFADKLFQEMIGSEHMLTVSRQGNQRLIRIVEQQVATLEMTVQHQLERTSSIGEVAPQPRADFYLGLLHPRDG